MLVADGGGGGGTNWYAMTVEDMQKLIQQPDTAAHYELLTGWKQSADLITEHRWQVQNYRDNLAAVWPPEKNEAAFAYLTRLDELIQNLDDTYEAALANHDAFASATLSISLAQKDIQAIYDEYTTNSQLLTTFNAQQLQSQKADPGLTSTEKPPVADGRQEELRQRAAALLSTVSSDLAQAQVSIRTPTPYTPQRFIGDGNSNEGSTYSAPAIPPIIPAPVDNGSTVPQSKASRPATVFPTAPSAVSPQPITTTPVTGTSQPGLVLGGTSAPPPPPPPTTAFPSPSPAIPTGGGGPIGPITSPGLFPPGSNKPLPGVSRNLIPPTTNGQGHSGGISRETVTRPTTSSTGAVHALPPGGMIGGTPAVGIGQPNTGRPTASRVNPVGGVIGNTPSSGRTTTRGFTSTENPGHGVSIGQAPGQRSNRGEKCDENRWDPDNPWKTAEGVAPVVLPSKEQRVDPGPAIGLN
ncbi:hypothetical protein ACQPZJ_47500 [Actinoplanes sp. CA-054009]